MRSVPLPARTKLRKQMLSRASQADRYTDRKMNRKIDIILPIGKCYSMYTSWIGRELAIADDLRLGPLKGGIHQVGVGAKWQAHVQIVLQTELPEALAQHM